MAATTAVSSSAAAADRETVGKYWWLALAAGVLTVIVGLVALVYPGPTLLAVGIIFGAYLTFWGAMMILRGTAGERGTSTAFRVAVVLIGVLTVLTGLVLIVRPGESVVTAAWVLGFWWVISGVIQLMSGIAEREQRGWNIALGLLGIVAGAVILAQPEIGLVTLVWIVGFGLIFKGVLEIFAGLQIRKAHKEGLL